MLRHVIPIGCDAESGRQPALEERFESRSRGGDDSKVCFYSGCDKADVVGWIRARWVKETLNKEHEADDSNDCHPG